MVALPTMTRAPRSRLSRASSAGIGGGAVHAVALRQRVDKIAGRLQRHIAEQRIGAVDRLDLDQRSLAEGARAIARMVAAAETFP